MCILGAAPFAAMGFITYHGMTCEQFLWAWFRSELLEPKRLYFKPTNLYYEALKDTIAEHEKEMLTGKKKVRKVKADKAKQCKTRKKEGHHA